MVALPRRLRSLATARIATGTILCGVLFLVIFELWVSPWLRDHMGGEKLLDLMYWRTPGDVTSSLETYGSAGRDFYRRVLLVDLAFPLVYCPPLALSVAFATSQVHRLRRYAGMALLLPVAGGLFDWGENVSLWMQTGRFPDNSDSISWLAFTMTLLKFATLSVSLLTILWGLWASRLGRRP